MRRLGLMAAVCALLLSVGGGVASAHPLGNFTINRYAGLTVHPDALDIDYVIDLAEIPAYQERFAIDADGDSSVSSDELAAYAVVRCDAFASGLAVSIDGRRLPLTVTAALASMPIGQAGLSTLRIECAYRGAFASASLARSLEIDDDNYAGRLGWRELTARGDGVVLETALPRVSASARLTAYPRDLLSSPLDLRRGAVRFSTDAAVRPNADAPERVAPAPALTDPLTTLLGQRDLSLAGMIAAIAIAFGLGIAHALSPGHGKTVIAAYLVGTSGSRAQAVVLGPLVAMSHTAGVLLLGAVTLVASQFIAPERLYPYLSAAAGLVVVALGAMLVRGRIRARAHGHDHIHAPSRPSSAFGWRPLVALGLSGGIVPSASALVLLLASIHFGQLVLGFVLILSFGLGMAATLVGVGIALVGAARLAHGATRRGLAARVLDVVPELTAAVVLLFGIGMTAQALASVL